MHVSVWNDNRDRDTKVQVHGPVHAFQRNFIPIFVLRSDYQRDQRVLFQRHRLLKLVYHLLHLSKWRSVILQQQSPVRVSQLSMLTIHRDWMQSRRLGTSQLSLRVYRRIQTYKRCPLWNSALRSITKEMLFCQRFVVINEHQFRRLNKLKFCLFKCFHIQYQRKRVGMWYRFILLLASCSLNEILIYRKYIQKQQCGSQQLQQLQYYMQSEFYSICFVVQQEYQKLRKYLRNKYSTKYSTIFLNLKHSQTENIISNFCFFGFVFVKNQFLNINQ
ncbi:Hypothetical_protein [Hexamita inflata]|uniref:Hypothetical_protein n=1 Tax=Hexamita inflata TaxID=28002 RepID=A0AA86TPX3_9EUKA|nr:Hypothetical protein HINF_LOCUS10052 [Hexamita inflata]